MEDLHENDFGVDVQTQDLFNAFNRGMFVVAFKLINNGIVATMASTLDNAVSAPCDWTNDQLDALVKDANMDLNPYWKELKLHGMQPAKLQDVILTVQTTQSKNYVLRFPNKLGVISEHIIKDLAWADVCHMILVFMHTEMDQEFKYDYSNVTVH